MTNQTIKLQTLSNTSLSALMTPLIFYLSLSASLCPCITVSAWSLSETTATTRCKVASTTWLEMISNNGGYWEDDITRLQAKARLQLAKAKAKLEAKTNQQQVAEKQMTTNDSDTKISTTNSTTTTNTTMPFFAALQAPPTATTPPRRQIIKAVNPKGLVLADGEKMAQYSEQEPWERRGLLEVFENELKETDDVYSVASKQLAERDLAASIFNLRKELQTADFQKIFDPKNRFIGETD